MGVVLVALGLTTGSAAARQPKPAITVLVTTSPAYGRVTVDGRFIGEAPRTVAVPFVKPSGRACVAIPVLVKWFSGHTAFQMVTSCSPDYPPVRVRVAYTYQDAGRAYMADMHYAEVHYDVAHPAATYQPWPPAPPASWTSQTLGNTTYLNSTTGVSCTSQPTGAFVHTFCTDGKSYTTSRSGLFTTTSGADGSSATSSRIGPFTNTTLTSPHGLMTPCTSTTIGAVTYTTCGTRTCTTTVIDGRAYTNCSGGEPPARNEE